MSELTDRLTNLARKEGVAPGGGSCNLLMSAVEHIAMLEALLSAQVEFTEKLRHAATVAVAHASHIGQNYCRAVPDDKLKDWAVAQIEFSTVSITPSPAQSISAAARDGASVN